MCVNEMTSVLGVNCHHRLCAEDLYGMETSFFSSKIYVFWIQGLLVIGFDGCIYLVVQYMLCHP